MRVPPLCCCCCCCCAVLSLWGACECACLFGGIDSERQAKKHQYRSSILQWESPPAKYSSAAKITAKLRQFQWFFLFKGSGCNGDEAGRCVWLLFTVRGMKVSYMKIQTPSIKTMHRSLFFVRVWGNFQSPYAHVGNATYRCDESRQSRRNQKSPLQEKVTCAKLHTKWFTDFGIFSEYWYTQTYDVGPFSRFRNYVKVPSTSFETSGHRLMRFKSATLLLTLVDKYIYM